MNETKSTDFRGFLGLLKEQGDIASFDDEISLEYEIGALCRLLGLPKSV